MSDAIVLIHSPLVGPLTWQPVATELGRRQQQPIVPSLLPALTPATTPFWHRIADCVGQAVEQAGTQGSLVLVAHSAAGAFLPAIRQRLPNPVSGYLFVDARLPTDGMTLFTDSSEEEVDWLRGLAEEGWLPPWSDWFGEEAMREVLPEDALRAQFSAEQRPIPLALFEEAIPVFSTWPDAPCGYICFSKFYEPQLQEASERGWQTRKLDANHLHMLHEPVAVAELLLHMVGRLNVDSGQNDQS